MKPIKYCDFYVTNYAISVPFGTLGLKQKNLKILSLKHPGRILNPFSFLKASGWVKVKYYFKPLKYGYVFAYNSSKCISR
jgi:hypothetical protein